MGGTRSPIVVDLTRTVWQWCLERKISLVAQHIPGKVNFRADFLSRHLRDRTDWILNPELFSVINQQWGPIEVDLFASRFSAQLPLFYSWRPDPEAEATDAFAQDWNAKRGYAHPPWCLITRVLFKVQAQQASLVLVAPVWPTQVWFPVLVSMLVDIPILLPMKQDTLPKLAAWRVSGRDLDRRQFQRRLSKLVLASWREKTSANSS